MNKRKGRCCIVQLFVRMKLRSIDVVVGVALKGLDGGWVDGVKIDLSWFL